MKKRFRTVIIGQGERGRIHLHGLLKNDNLFEVVGVCDRKSENLQKSTEIYGVSRNKIFTNADRMMQVTAPEVLVFATMPHIRLPLVEMGIKYGVKGLLFEKPMATTISEAAKILDICRNNNIKAGICQQHKYLRSFDQIRKVLSTGELGEICEIRVSCKAHASQLGTHYIDYMIWSNGGFKAKAVVGHVHGNYYLDDSHPSPDYIFGQIAFENGVRGIIECGYFSPQRAQYETAFTRDPGEAAFWTDDRLTVNGTKGYAWAECGGRYACFTGSTAPEIVSGDYGDFFDHEQFYAQERYTAEYGRWLNGEGDFSCNIETAYHGFEILEAIYRSALNFTRVDMPLSLINRDDTMDCLKSRLLPVVYKKF
jgi:predicted dehydrogenase